MRLQYLGHSREFLALRLCQATRLAAFRHSVRASSGAAYSGSPLCAELSLPFFCSRLRIEIRQRPGRIIWARRAFIPRPILPSHVFAAGDGLIMARLPSASRPRIKAAPVCLCLIPASRQPPIHPGAAVQLRALTSTSPFDLLRVRFLVVDSLQCIKARGDAPGGHIYEAVSLFVEWAAVVLRQYKLRECPYPAFVIRKIFASLRKGQLSKQGMRQGYSWPFHCKQQRTGGWRAALVSVSAHPEYLPISANQQPHREETLARYRPWLGVAFTRATLPPSE